MARKTEASVLQFRRGMRRYLAATLLLIMASPTAGGADNALKDRLLTEGTRAWKELESYFAQSEGVFTTTWKDYMADRPSRLVSPTQVTTCEFLINKDQFRIRRIGSKGEWVETLNSQYVFGLHKNKGGDRYGLRQLDSNVTSSTEMRQGVAETKQTLCMAVFSPWYFYGPLHAVIKDPSFIIHNVTLDERNGIALVRMDFEAEGKSGQEEHRPAIASGHMFLDPAKNWTIQEYEIEVPVKQVKVTQRVKLEYGSPTDGYPCLHKKEMTMRRARGNEMNGNVQTETIVVEKLSHTVAPDKEFLLSSYGIPEPGFVSRNVHRALWLFLAALFLAICAYVIRIYLRRKAVSTVTRP